MSVLQSVVDRRRQGWRKLSVEDLAALHRLNGWERGSLDYESSAQSIRFFAWATPRFSSRAKNCFAREWEGRRFVDTFQLASPQRSALAPSHSLDRRT